MKFLKSGRKAVIVSVLCVSLVGVSFVSTPAYAFDPEVAAILNAVFSWMKQEMLSQLHNYTKEQTNAFTGKMDNIFKQKMGWERLPAGLKELFVEQSVKFEDNANQASYNSSKSYLSYAQGSASGADATKYPAQVVSHFNGDYKKVQGMSTSCQLTVPQPIGSTANQCQPAQTQFTNYLITGIHPMPDYPTDATKSASGEQYVAEKKVNETRTGLAQVALNQAVDTNTTKFIKYMQQNLQKPSIDQINSESSAAVARDTLIIEKAKAIIALKQYEVALMNERLLATIVAQNEDVHMQRIRALGREIH